MLPLPFTKRYLKSYVKRKLSKIQARVSELEIAVDALIENPKYVSYDENGFNGQRLRKQIFRELTTALKFNAIVETGTQVGHTTGYMAEVSGLPVYSCELNRRPHLIAKMRLSDFKNIRLELSDSLHYLNKLANSSLSQQNVFFYLDAHPDPGNTLAPPLGEEINIIANHWKDFVIMADDFLVPEDAGYKHNDYGKNNALSLKFIDREIKKHGLIPFFPSFPAAEETGYRAGCVVLTKTGIPEEQISRLTSLTRAKGF